MALTSAEKSRRYRDRKKLDPEWRSKKNARHKAWREKNPEYLRKSSADWHAKHKNDPEYKAMKTQNTLNYQKKYRGKVNAANNARRAAKLQATPDWLTASQILEIEQIYVNCPKDMEVDHIVPLQGKNVCGLHVPWNLQYLTPSENAAKGNRYP